MPSFFAYYKTLFKEFVRLCYESWRRELSAAVFVALIAYGITFRDKGAWESTKIALLANAILLFCLAVFHLVRVPWLVHSRTAPEVPVEKKRSMIFLGEEITPAFLVGLYEGHMSVQAEKLVEVYLNKWMRVSGTVIDVKKGWPTRDCMKVHMRWHGDNSHTVAVFLDFGKEWTDRVLILKSEQRVTVLGKVHTISNYIALKDCELES